MGKHVRNNDLPFIKKGWIGNRVHLGRFVNRNLSNKHGVKRMNKWRLSLNSQLREKLFNKWQPDVQTFDSLDNMVGDHMIWLGHNSFYMSLDGKRIMFDPVFGNIPFVKRQSQLPTDPSIFKNIDYLLLSHDHFDHLDKKSVRQICEQSPDVVVICGLGVDTLVKRWMPKIKTVGMAWYQQFVDGGMKFTFLPSQHWSKRSVKDGGQRLWGAFFIEAYSKNLYYSGDTGYGDHFKEVNELFGEVDYALIGIGAYKPRWIMERNHISPQEALDAAIDMKAKVTIPMHYGTFNLSKEPLNDPPKVFSDEADKRNINVYLPAIGEHYKM